VHDRAQALSVSEWLTAPGTYLPQADVLALVQGAGVAVIPNLPTRLNQFALSSKLFEYVALGIPVVSADLPTIRAHFDDSEIRYFRAGDAESLAQAIIDVARNPDVAACRVAAARARYERYRWPRNAARYVALLGRSSRDLRFESRQAHPV
jgi:glycosyltransferase involved in cell wall biosynthesis